MALKELTLKDKDLFNRFLNFSGHELSVYTFENIYIWKGLFCIRWALLSDNLCVFFKDKIGCFLYLPPLGKEIKQEAVEESFEIMDRYNKNEHISRIENIEEKDLRFYRSLGLTCKEKYPEYLCKREDLAELGGDKFKAKRASCNHFSKNYQCAYQPFSGRDIEGCLRLYNRWMKGRKAVHQGSVYQAMLLDARNCLMRLLKNYRHLNLTGRIVKISGRIQGFTFGFKINPQIFCILYEVTDLSVKGLAQFIFRQFCRELRNFKYINIMDDSGLENLKQVKLSYRPVKAIPAYIATRNA